MKPLAHAAYAGDLDRIRELLAQGHDINERSEDNETPLHIAVNRGEIELVRYLVEQGADIEAKDLKGHKPLWCSFFSAYFEIFAFLISSGTDLSFRDKQGLTVLHCIVMYDRGPTWLNCLFDAVDIDPRTLFSMKDNDGDTPLHLLQSLTSAKFLVEYGYDSSTTGLQSTWMCPTLLSIRNKQGKTPYEAVKQSYKKEVIVTHMYLETCKYLYSFESLPLVDLATMKLSPGLNEFQRFLARRIYYAILCKLPSGPDFGRRIMAFLAPTDVMR